MRHARRHLGVLLAFVLLESMPTWAENTTRPADRPEIIQIDRWVSDIDQLQLKPKITDVIFDCCEGSSLTWFTHQKQRPKVSWSVRTSSDVQVADFYLRNGKLILICLRKMDYPKNPDGTPIHDMNRLTLAARAWIYFKDDKMILTVAEPGMTDITKDFIECEPLLFTKYLLKNWEKQDLDLNSLLRKESSKSER